MSGERILVIKLSALGDIVQALGPMAAIRAQHPGAEITLLTTAPYAEWLGASPYVDRVWIDRRPGPLDLPGWLALRHQLRGGRFTRVYDLQTSSRSSRYRLLFLPGSAAAPVPEWSGIAWGASHPDADPNRDHLHTLDRQAGQLRAAGIAHVPPPTLDWCRADLTRFALPPRYALLVPGGSAHRPEKRWPTAGYAAVAQHLADRGITPLLIGTAAEAETLSALAAAEPRARSLGGQTGFADLAVLARGAVCAVGNDTGPMHLIAAAGCPSVVLFSAASDPALCAPRGPGVTILRRPNLSDLPVETVCAALP